MNRAPKLLWILLALICSAGILQASLPPTTIGAWTSAVNLSQARANAASVLLSDGRILITGGDGGSGALYSAELFTPTGTVTAAANMNVARSGHFAVALSDGRVLVGGGNSSGGGATNSAEIYDPSTDSWTQIGPMTAACANASAALLQDGRVLIAGGDNSGTPSNTIEIFDPSTGNFSFAGTLSSPRTKQAMAVLQDGRVLIVGGFDGTNALASSDIFDPSSGTVSAGPLLATPRYSESATTLLNGQVVVIGGATTGNSGTVDVASAEVFDPATGVFGNAGVSLTTAREEHQAFLLPSNNSVLIVGGTSGGQVVAASELFVPQVSTADGSWSYALAPTASNVTPRTAAAGSAMNVNGLLLVAGGNDASGNALANTELYAFPVVKTDATDYPPGTTVNISGSGFKPGEVVNITIVESPLIDTPGPFTATADGNGNFTNSSFTTDINDVNVRFWLSAVGSQSGLVAQNTFTDANNPTLQVTVIGPISSGTVSSADGNINKCAAAPLPGTKCSHQYSGSFSTTVTASPNAGFAFVGWSGSCSGTGTCSASGNGNQTFAATATFAANQAPAIISLNNTTFTVGSAGSFTVTDTGVPTPTLSETGSLPSGVTFNASTGVLSGTPAVNTGGTYPIIFTASNGIGSNAVQNFTLTVNQAPAITSANNAAFTIGTSGSFTVAASGFPAPTLSESGTLPNGVTFNTSTGVLSGTAAAGTGGTYPIIFTASNGVGTGATQNFTLTVGQAPSITSANNTTFTVTNAGSFTVSATGFPAPTFSETGALPSGVTFTAAGVLSGTPAAGTAGSYPITITASNGTNPNATQNFTLTVAKATATFASLTASQSISYGTASISLSGKVNGPQMLTGTVSITINGVTMSGIAVNGNPNNFGPVAFNTAAIPASSTPYTITYTYTGDANSTTATDTTTSLTVNKANATITVTPYSITYDGHAHTAAITSIMGVNGETGATVGTVDVSNTTHTNAGTYNSDSWSFTGTANYNNIAATTITDTINKATATVVVTPYTVTYDGGAHTAAITSITGVNGETGATVGTVDVSNTNHTNAGTYSSDSWSFTGTANYNNIAPTTITDAVNKANATVVITPYTVTYDGTAHTAAITSITGVKSETGATVGTVTLNTTHTNAGTYSTDSWSFTGSPNYNDIAATTITDTINKANAVVVVTPYTVTYDGQSHTATVASITGVNSETGAAVGTVDVSHTTHAGAGTYSTDNWTFTGGANYNNIAATTITDTINKANATVVVTPYTVTYDGQSHTATVTSITGVNGETGAAVGTVTLNTTHTNAGTYAADYWAFTGSANYNNIGNTTITDTIDKANATVAVMPYTVTYDGSAHTAAVTSITGVNGETGATVGTVDVSNSTHTNAGTYSNDSWSFTGAANYNNIAAITIADTINKADATVVVTPYAVTYDGNPHTATGAATGVKGESLSGLDLSGTTHTNAGTYGGDPWTFTDSTGNYNNSSGVANDSIAKANAVINVTSYNVTYDGNSHTATDTVTGVKGEALAGLDLSGTAHINAGDYPTDPWTFTDVTGNYYNSAGTVHDSIVKANAVISVTPYSVTYDGAAHTAAGTATGVKNETLTGLSLSGTSHTNAGTYNSDPWTFTDVTGNYNNASGTVNDVIAKANPNISVTPYSVNYDGNPHTATGSVTGVKGEALAGLDLSATTHTNAGSYMTDPWTFTDATGNYNNANGTVSDSIAKANAAINVTPYIVTYDGNAHTATGSATGVKGEALSGLNLSGTTHTNAGTYPTDPWTFTDTTGNYNNANGTVADSIAKANAKVVVTPYTVIYDGNQHTATVTSITGVNGETGAMVGTVDVSNTTHTNPGDYPADPWSFTGATNYNNTSGTVHDSISFSTACIAGAGDAILPPINSNGTSVYKRQGGSTIPVKFRVCDASGNAISNASLVFGPSSGSITMLSAARGTVDSVNETTVNNIADVAFRWDSSGQQWIFNMATTNLTSGLTYQFRINLANATQSIIFVVGVQ